MQKCSHCGKEEVRKDLVVADTSVIGGGYYGMRLCTDCFKKLMMEWINKEDRNYEI